MNGLNAGDGTPHWGGMFSRGVRQGIKLTIDALQREDRAELEALIRISQKPESQVQKGGDS
jgi:hypothetical protein